MRVITSSWSLVFVLAVIAMSIRANSTTIPAYSMEDLVRAADLVVMGHASKIEHQRDKRGKTVRKVTFEVDQYVVGSGKSAIEIKLFGGTLDGVVSKVSGEADLPLNRPTLLFVRASQTDESVYHIVGMAQGHFRIILDPKTQSRFVTRSLTKDLHLINEIKNDKMGLGSTRTSSFIPFEQFISEIRRLQDTQR